MTRILQIVPDINGGGVGSVVYNYMSHMDKDGVEIVIATDKHDGKQMLEDSFRKEGIKVITITPRKQSISQHFKEVADIIKKGDFDVVHCHQQNWAPFYLVIAKFYGVKKRLAHSHVTIQLEDKLKIRILNCFKPLLKLVATGKFCCGREAGIYMWGKKAARKNELYVMRNAVDIDKFKFNEEERNCYRRQLGIEDNFVVGHVGRFEPQKNHKYLIDIFSRYCKINNNAVLLLIGEGSLKEETQKQVKACGIEDNVRFLGLRNDVPRLINAFDLFLLPSIYEGLPVVGIEMQTNGIPCLLSTEITDEGLYQENSMRIDLSTPQKWLDEISKIQKQGFDPEKRKNAYRDTISNGYSIIQEAEKLKQYYASKNIKK